MRWKVVRIAVVIAAVAVLGALWWRHHRGASPPAAANATTHAPAAPHRGARPPSRPTAIAGRVTRRRDGGGIAGAVVALTRKTDGMAIREPDAPLVATTAADGTWSAVATPGRYTVTATADGFVPATEPGVDVAAGEQRTGVVLVLDAGGTLVHGTVTDIGGGPIPGTQIQVWDDDRQGRLVALADKDGAYRVTLRPGHYFVTARRDDYIEKVRSIAVAATPLTEDFALVPGGVIRGAVLASDTNQPVPHARVTAEPAGGDFAAHLTEPEATAGDDGTFELTGCPSGQLALSASGLGYATQKPTTVRLGIGEAVAGIDVRVERAFSISGHVVAADSHAPIAGVTVGVGSFMAGATRDGLAEEPTGSDGAFVVGGLAPGTYMTVAQSDDLVPNVGVTVGIVDRNVSGIELVLERGVAISGRVEPAGAAHVELEVAGELGFGNMMQMMKLSGVQTTTDATGAWTIEHAPAGSWKLVARADDGAAGELPITVTAKQAGLVIALSPRASIAGRVVDTDGKPAGGVEVWAIAVSAAPRAGFRSDSNHATTADDGTFAITGLAGGKYLLSAGELAAMGRAEKDRKDLTIDVPPGTANTGVVMTIAAKTGVIRGRVLGADKQPVADAWVSSRSDEDAGMAFFGTSDPALTGGDGAFELNGLAPGTYTLVVDGGKLPAHGERRDVHTGTTVDIQLEPLGKLSGRVTSGGAPVTRYRLACDGPSGETGQTVANDGGTYELDNLPPGPYWCTASSDTGEAAGTIEVRTGPAALDLALAGYGSLTGTVVSSVDGSPLAGLAITPQDSAHFMAVFTGGGAHTDAAGRFRVDRVAAGSGSIAVYSSSGSMWPLGAQPYTMTAAGNVDVGTIKVSPHAAGDAGSGEP